MWYTPYETSTRKRIWKYFLWVVLILWILVSFVFGYFYLLATWSQQEKKWGTFVEWIFDEVSYLPYLKSDDQSIFYQKFLFKSCLDLYNLNIITTEEWWKYAEWLCKVYTEDNKNYTIKLIDENAEWSDWTPVNIQDVFFTYDEILRQNRWDIQSLNAWNSITVALEDWKVKVVFPTASIDNINFFTNAILPKHVVEWMDLDTYKDYFSLSPVTNWCAKIMPQTKDVNSLIFDLNACDDTKFSYYQVKNYWSFEEFENSLIWKKKKAMVDVYQSIYGLEWFTWQDVLTSKLLWIFFNTDSGKANIRLRRALWWLIYHNFFTWGYEQYINKYEWDFLNYYLSAWENVVDLLNRINLSDEDLIDAFDLKDSWAQELPASMSINWVDRKFVFFMQKPSEARNLEIKFSNEFSDIKVKSSTDGYVWSPKWYNAKDKKINYKLQMWQNLNVWINNFTISWFIKKKTYTIASIDVYVFENLETNKNADNDWKLSVLYYNDPASVFAVQQMRDIFKNAWILDHFIFEPVYNVEELEWKFVVWTYDIYVWAVDLWSRNDILNLFGTEDPKLNPSRYRNPILTSMIGQYRKTHDDHVQWEINALLAQDMPVIFLWNTYDKIQLQEKIKESVFPNDEEWNKMEVYANKWRDDIYSKYSIVHSVRLDNDKAFNRNNFEEYILSNLFSDGKVDFRVKETSVENIEASDWESVEQNEIQWNVDDDVNVEVLDNGVITDDSEIEKVEGGEKKSEEWKKIPYYRFEFADKLYR